MHERLIGLETEYAVSAGRVGLASVRDTPGVLERIMTLAKARLSHLPAANGDAGIFLACGGRLYIDRTHPEWATPECPEPAAVLLYREAADRLLSALCAEISSTTNSEVNAWAHNLDYRSGSSWACHENYCHQVDWLPLRQALVPHLVSRIIYSGSGGFEQVARHRLGFVLSPRASFISLLEGPETTKNRALINTREEHHSQGPWRRLHLHCGESHRLRMSGLLKLGVTALVILLAERGISGFKDIELGDPLAALRHFNRDITGQNPFPGTSWSALGIQRRYLEWVIACLDADWMPSWGRCVVKAWRRVMDLLASRGPAALAGSIDWATRLHLFEQVARRRDVYLDSFCAPSANASASRPSQDATSELLAVDLDYARLGSGIFSQLEDQGAIEHGVPIADVDRALGHPPQFGRARIRGQFVREHSGASGAVVNWTYLEHRDGEDRKVLLINDPFSEQPEPVDPRVVKAELSYQPIQTESTDRALQLYDAGDYERARDVLLQNRPATRGGSRFLLFHYSILILVESRRGETALTDAALEEYRRDGASDLQTLLAELIVDRFGGLMPRAVSRLERSMAAVTRLTEGNSRLRGDFSAMAGHVAHVHNRRRAPLKAEELLTKALGDAGAHPNVRGRLLGEMGESRRLQGDLPRARRFLRQATRLQQRRGYLGDLADFTLPYLAKAEGAVPRARKHLRWAEAIQRETRNRVGLARTLLLKARLSAPLKRRALGAWCQELKTLQEAVPTLRECPLLQRILDHWDVWSSGGHLEGEPDPLFWGL